MLVSDAVKEARRYLGGDDAQRDKVNGAINSSATALVLTYGANLALGSVIETASGELLYVWAYNSGTKTATVERGYDGTTAASVSNNEVVRINPRYTQHRILQAMRDELSALSSEGLYERKSAAITWDSSDGTFSITGITDMLSPYSIKYVPTSGVPYYEFNFYRRDTYIRPHNAPPLNDGGTATLYYRAPLVAFTAVSDDLTTVCGLPSSAHDIVGLGAAARLLATQEARRTDTHSQQHVRNPQDVPVGAVTGLARQLRRDRDLRLRGEVRRLREVWPMRMR